MCWAGPESGDGTVCRQYMLSNVLSPSPDFLRTITQDHQIKRESPPTRSIRLITYGPGAHQVQPGHQCSRSGQWELKHFQSIESEIFIKYQVEKYDHNKTLAWPCSAGLRFQFVDGGKMWQKLVFLRSLPTKPSACFSAMVILPYCFMSAWPVIRQQ